MTILRLVGLVVTLGLVTSVFPANAKPTAQAKKLATKSIVAQADTDYNYIKQAYDYQCSGYPALDVNIVMSYRTANFVASDARGITWTKNGLTSTIYDLFKQASQYNITLGRKITITQVTFTQNQAIVTETSHTWTKLTNGTDPNAISIAMDSRDGTFRDTWMRTSSGWAEQSSVRIGEGG